MLSSKYKARHANEPAEHYARVVDAWKNADPELAPQLDYARRRLSAINIE